MIVVITLSVTYIISVYTFETRSDFGTTKSLIALSALFFAMVAGLAALKISSTITSIPDLPSGRVGIRAWASEVEFTEIKIGYLNDRSEWVNVPDDEIFRKSNWIIEEVWTVKTSELGEPTNEFDDANKFIKLKNCGAVFFYTPVKSKDLRIQAVVKFEGVESDFKKWLSNCQLCLRVPDTYKSELYLGFELPFHKPLWSKVWIPGLDLQPQKLYQSHVSELVAHGGFHSIEKDVKYKLSAVTFGNIAQFKGMQEENNWSVILYEGKFHDEIKR
jgi:hypothetical protein